VCLSAIVTVKDLPLKLAYAVMVSPRVIVIPLIRKRGADRIRTRHNRFVRHSGSLNPCVSALLFPS
jgi:hypothetical protein